MSDTREINPIKRIKKELSHLWIDPPAFCRPGGSAVTDPFHWEVIIDGPDGSPYAGGTFPVDVKFPNSYPFKPPKLTFKTKVYHPNINSEGKMFLDIFKDNWSPALTIEKLLLSIVSVLHDPLLDRPVHRGIAHQYKYERDLYETKARDWTRRYASTPILSFYPGKADRSGCDWDWVSIIQAPQLYGETTGSSASACFLFTWWKGKSYKSEHGSGVLSARVSVLSI